ncbi:MAG TPA: hypothetical protein DGD08_00560 [Gemmatimonas aurantiaca]|nr:hypothetical protein [Gemmatimonas aurantiaca]HCT55681.1 hypothetical protein [Gemmatimonas aurantiaca]
MMRPLPMSTREMAARAGARLIASPMQLAKQNARRRRRQRVLTMSIALFVVIVASLVGVHPLHAAMR